MRLFCRIVTIPHSHNAIMAFVHCSSVAWRQGECRGYGSGHVAPVMIKNGFPSNRRTVTTAARQGSPAPWPGTGPWWQAGSIPTASVLSFLWRSSFPTYLGGGGGAISGQSFRCWKEDWSPAAPCAVRKQFYQRMVREFNLVASNCPHKQPVFPSPWEGGGMTGF